MRAASSLSGAVGARVTIADPRILSWGTETETDYEIKAFYRTKRTVWHFPQKWTHRRSGSIVQTSCCKGEPSMHVQWVSGVCAPVKSVASSRPKVDTPVLFLIRCRWASHARKQRSIWGDFSLQRRRASESTLIWACLRVRHHAIVCGHKQRDCPVSVFSAAGAAPPQ